MTMISYLLGACLVETKIQGDLGGLRCSPEAYDLRTTTQSLAVSFPQWVDVR